VSSLDASRVGFLEGAFSSSLALLRLRLRLRLILMTVDDALFSMCAVWERSACA
jgi:hypothetical protein